MYEAQAKHTVMDTQAKVDASIRTHIITTLINIGLLMHIFLSIDTK